MIGMGSHAGIHLRLLGMALLWGLSWPSGRVLAQSLPPLSVSAWRFSLASVVLLIWMRWRLGAWPRWSARQWLGLVATGAVGVFGYSVFFMLALHEVEASRAAVVVTTNPVFVTLLAAWLFGEVFNWRIALGLGLAVWGAATVMTRGAPWMLLSGGVGHGEWLLLGCVGTWVSYSLMGKRLMVGVDALSATAITATVGGLLLWAAALGLEGPAQAFGRLSTLSGLEGFNLVFMAMGPTVLAYAWFYRGIEALGANF